MDQLGAGTAVPTATLLSMLLASRSFHVEYCRVHIVVADYNSYVLMLATIPNLLLAFAARSEKLQPWPDQGDLDITANLLSDFHAALASANIHISGISGAWGPDFEALARSNVTEPACSALVLASETIYSPGSIRVFSKTVLGILDQNGKMPDSQALVAAKKVYFGVGGGVDEFTSVMGGMGSLVKTVWDSSEDSEPGTVGVGRCILGLKLKSQVDGSE